MTGQDPAFAALRPPCGGHVAGNLAAPRRTRPAPHPSRPFPSLLPQDYLSWCHNHSTRRMLGMNEAPATRGDHAKTRLSQRGCLLFLHVMSQWPTLHHHDVRAFALDVNVELRSVSYRSVGHRTSYCLQGHSGVTSVIAPWKTGVARPWSCEGTVTPDIRRNCDRGGPLSLLR